jgi:hypothetical protein
MTESKQSKPFWPTNTFGYKALKTLNILRGSITLSSLAPVALLIWAMYVIFSTTPTDRYRSCNLTFNYEEEAACESEITQNSRPYMVQKIQSNPHNMDYVPLKGGEYRLLHWHKNKSHRGDSDRSKEQVIMGNYIQEYLADRNDGYVLKFYIPQHGPRKGKVSAPVEIEPYIQSAINRCIDQHDDKDFSGGGVIGKLEKDMCIYEKFYLVPSKWNRYLETAHFFLKFVGFSALFFLLLLALLLLAIPSIFITLAILESILMLVILSFKPSDRQCEKPVPQDKA